MFNKTNGRASNGRSFSRDGGKDGARNGDDRRSKSFSSGHTNSGSSNNGGNYSRGRNSSGNRSGGFSGSRGGFGGGSRSGGRGGGRKMSVFNDISKFINKSNVKEIRVADEVYVPENSFFSLNIDERLKKNILDSGYINPTLIQDKSILSLLAGKDLVGIANTGTGKTAAFLLPLINKVLKNKKEMVIILAPTRELAVQIDDEFKKFTKGLKIWSICAVGGMPIFKQIKDFKYDHNFVIGTPGRLKDLIERGVINIKEFGTIVLDESDRMLDMGFVDDMKFLMREIPKPHQTIFFSATVSPAVSHIIKEFLVRSEE
ncbi:MAG: ATP-dependent helicase DeaD, partial [Patescibacteria group bacterium]|nr:ATP-dependent helicase DeaD [Patescibacteria group bacterium]